MLELLLRRHCFIGRMELGNNGPRELFLGIHRVEFARGHPFTIGLDFGCRTIRKQQPVLPHEFIGDGHELAEHLERWILHGNIVPEGFGHLLDAVEPLEQRQRHDHLRFLSILAHEVAADQEIEELIGAAELHIDLEGDGVIGLRQRVEKLVQRDGLLGLVSLS